MHTTAGAIFQLARLIPLGIARPTSQLPIRHYLISIARPTSQPAHMFPAGAALSSLNCSSGTKASASVIFRPARHRIVRHIYGSWRNISACAALYRPTYIRQLAQYFSFLGSVRSALLVVHHAPWPAQHYLLGTAHRIPRLRPAYLFGLRGTASSDMHTAAGALF